MVTVRHRQLRNARAQNRRPTGIVTYDWTSFDPSLLAERKARQGCAVSVCLPARDEQDTVGAIVTSIRRHLQEYVALVDELIVVDGGSCDRTAIVAADAGATVVDVEAALPGFGPSLGKGDVLWRSLAISTGDIVVWCDSDVITFGPQFVYGLLGPLLTVPEVQFSKACFNRNGDDDMASSRVTELLAKPLLRLLRPDLAALNQPLSGSYAGRRTLLEQLEFEPDFGVEIGLLIDAVDLVGAAAIAQVDIGTFRHPHRTTAQLAPQAAGVARAVLGRCPGVDISDPIDPARLDHGHTVDVPTGRRPPLSELRAPTGASKVRRPNRPTQ